MQPMPGPVPGMIGITPPDSHPDNREEETMSWKPEVIVHGENSWVANGLRFATQEEAFENASHLALRWMAVRDFRAAQSDDAVNYSYANGKLEDVTNG